MVAFRRQVQARSILWKISAQYTQLVSKLRTYKNIFCQNTGLNQQGIKQEN